MRSLILAIIISPVILLYSTTASSTPKSTSRAKFYDFSEMLIDGEVKKPTGLYTDVRRQVRFERLLKLKKSFLKALLSTGKDRVFK